MITHYYHSGFSVANGDTLLVFDYWRGEEGELTEALQLSEEQLRAFANVVVFISHEHVDHLDPIVFTWKDLTNVSYIVSSDMPVGTRGKRMAPGDMFTPVEGVDVLAYDSTDLGVSFLVDFRGVKFFHAGDLNFWHWREESTMREIEEADAEFRKAVAPLKGVQIDVAFFPVDPRQGTLFEAGANYFILCVKPRILIPMHYFHRADVALEYARTASCPSTEVVAMPLYGDALTLSPEEDGYFDIQFSRAERISPDEMPSAGGPPPAPEAPPEPGEPLRSDEPETPETEAVPEPVPPPPEPASADGLLDEDDPFAESDLPVAQLLDSEEESGDM